MGNYTGKLDSKGLTEIPELSAAGRTSTAIDGDFESAFYALAGFRTLGSKAVRIDILERLADIIRPITSWKPEGETEKPEGAVDGRAFYVTPAMMSILGATHDDMTVILKNLGYREDKRLETEIKPVEADTAVEAIKEETSAPENQSQPETSSDNTGQENSEATPDEPKMISIWRYGGASGSGNKTQNPQSTRKFQKRKGGKPSGKSPGNKKPPHKKFAKPEKEPDPDSPFAKLAALKSTLSAK